MNPTESNLKFCLGINISMADYHVALSAAQRENSEVNTNANALFK